MSMFVNRSSVQGIKCGTTVSNKTQVVFEKIMRQPVTVCTKEPLKAPIKHAYEVVMPIKEGMTAFGYMSEPLTNAYMTPSYTKQDNYISMGGAGYVYPASRVSQGRYGAGDVVRVELDLNEQGQGTVRYLVNGRLADTSRWLHGPTVYPAISCANGQVVCDVTWCEP